MKQIWTIAAVGLSWTVLAADSVVTARVVTVSREAYTFGKALEKVGEIRATDPEAPVDIVVADGQYALRSPLLLDGTLCGPSAGPLTIRAATDAKPRLMGSVPVRGWTRVRKMNGRSDIWEADVSALELTDQLDALYCEGTMLTLARYPNADPEAPYAGGWAYVPGKWVSMYAKVEGETRDKMPVGDADWHDWSVPSEGRIVIFALQRYGSAYVRIADVDRAKKRLMFAKSLNCPARPGDTYILSGFREELDCPGEWCHDLKAQKLYLIPPKGKDPNKLLITAPVAETVFRLKNAHNVTVAGLELCAARKVAVVDGGRAFTLLGCDVHDISTRAIELNHGKNHQLRDCDFHELGQGVMHCTGGSGRHDPSGIVVDNCYVHHIGKVDHAAAAFFLEAHAVTMTHNLMHDLPGWGVFHCGGWHTFADNRVHHYMLETEDGAAFYTCNYFGGIGTTFARNWVSDGIGFGKAAAVGPYTFYLNSHAFYFDAGPGNSYVYDNVVERTSGPALKFNGCRCMTVSNNVFAAIGRREMRHWSHATLLNSGAAPDSLDGTQAAMVARDPKLAELPAFALPPSKWPEHVNCWSNVFVRNIWTYPDAPEQLYVLVQGAKIPLQTFDYNWISIGKESDAPRLWDGWTFKETWQRKFGADVHSRVAKDIKFVDPKKGDFTPKDKAMMKKLGIRPLVMKNCGLYVTPYRPKLPKEADGAANHPKWLQIQRRK